MIFVNRDRKADVTRVNAEISKNITKDQGVFLFPESTTSNGEGILPFKSSLFQFPATEGIEVTSAAISYSSEDPNVEVSSEICWWDDQKLVHSNRKNLACTTFDIIQDLFEPVKQPKTNAESTSSVTV
jgi:1-acyl-sn-glycerol-3-phosphate acyltransferase